MLRRRVSKSPGVRGSPGQSGSVDGWDSLATATLLGVVEEEFGVDVGDFDALDSFESLLAYVEGAVSR